MVPSLDHGLSSKIGIVKNVVEVGDAVTKHGRGGKESREPVVWLMCPHEKWRWLWVFLLSRGHERIGLCFVFEARTQRVVNKDCSARIYGIGHTSLRSRMMMEQGQHTRQELGL